MLRSVRVLVLAVAVATAGLVASPAAAATRAKPFDIDGDGRQDLVVGGSGEDVRGPQNEGEYLSLQGAGQIHVVYTNRRGLTRRDELRTAKEGYVEELASYGATVASGDFNRDGFADLGVGAVREAAEQGRVYLTYGLAGGINRNRDDPQDRLTGSSGGLDLYEAQSGDRFGSALAVGDFDSDGFDDIAASAPYANRGRVFVWYGGRRGIGSRQQEWNPSDLGMPGQADVDPEVEAQNFGSSLAPADIDADGHDDLVIGASDSRVNGDGAAGAVYVLYGSAQGLTTDGSEVVHQDSPGIQDQAESRPVTTEEEDSIGDRFGITVAAGDFDRDGHDDVAVGVPDEAVKPVNGGSFAGAAQVIYGTTAGLGRRDQFFTQFDKRLSIPHRRTGSSFGSAVAAGDLDRDGRDDLAIGAPYGATQDNRRGGGFVVVMAGTSDGLRRADRRFLSQDSYGVDGHGERGDFFGESLAVRNLGRRPARDLVVGAPGEDLGAHLDTGVVHVFWGGSGGASGQRSRQWSEDGPGMKDAVDSADGSGRVSGTYRFPAHRGREIQ